MKSLSRLQPGDHVTVLRDLNHPAHKAHGSDVPDELVGELKVVKRHKISTMPGFRDRATHVQVRLSNGLWYDVDTGYEADSRATRIDPRSCVG